MIRLLTALIGLLGAVTANSDAPLLWRIDGANNTLYLLGSVHALRASDYPLPAGVDGAYRDAELVVMELDMDDLDPTQMQQALMELGVAGAGDSLPEVLGEQDYAASAARLADFGIEIELLRSLEPWFAALTLVNLRMMELGYDPSYGIEAHFTRKAVADGKELIGLETVGYQLGLFDALPMHRQRELFLKSIDDVAQMPSELAKLIEAWKRGDEQVLVEELLDSFEDHPRLYEALVLRRNETWLERIDALLEDERDVLVVVGALHLVGDRGLPAMLAARGHQARRDVRR